MDTYSFSSFSSFRFIYAEHQERYFSLVDMKNIEERAFNLHPDEHPNILATLKKHKESVLELYANAYRPVIKDTTTELELISWVIGKQIQFDWNTVNMLLKMKFRKPNCEYLL